MFAAQYYLYMMRRRELQDAEDLLQRQTWYQHPGRYQELFFDARKFMPEPLDDLGSDIEEVVDDIDEMDAYFDNLEATRTVSGGGMVSGMFGERDEQGWV